MVEGLQTHMDVCRRMQTHTDERKANCVRWVGGCNLRMIDVCSRTFRTYYMCCSITLTFAIYSPDGAQHWITNITNSFAPQVSAEEGSLKHFCCCCCCCCCCCYLFRFAVFVYNTGALFCFSNRCFQVPGIFVIYKPGLCRCSDSSSSKGTTKGPSVSNSHCV